MKTRLGIIIPAAVSAVAILSGLVVFFTARKKKTM